jgi:hypothetical protein
MCQEKSVIKTTEKNSGKKTKKHTKEKLVLCIPTSDRKFSVSVSVSAEISVSVLVSVSVSVYFKLSVSAEISVQNATENRNLKTIFHTTYFPF